ncbi:MAG: MaoC family dehydratase N-terminal domain-containing protein [Acidimicrobiales bacterium]
MVTAEPTTLVLPEMIDLRGVWGPVRVSPPVTASDIRKWAIAVYWPETPPRIHWDQDYAGGTRWGGVIAPPEFNPFAWPILAQSAAGDAPGGEPRWYDAEAAIMARNDGEPAVGWRGMNGGQRETYGEPMRPGDVISTRSRLSEWEERTTRLGLTLFMFTETEWRNQADQLVKRRVSTLIRY